MVVERVGGDGLVCPIVQAVGYGSRRAEVGAGCGDACVLRGAGVRVGDGCALSALGVIHRARDVVPIRSVLGDLDAASLGVRPEGVAVDDEVRAVGVRGIVGDRVLELIDGVSAEEAEGDAGRAGSLDRAVAVIRIAPTAGRHALVDELRGSRKVSVERRTSRRRAAAGLCAVERCRTDIARAGDGHGGSRGRGQNDDAVIRRGALDVVAVRVGHIAAVAIFFIRPMERAAVADGDAGDLRAVAHNQRETERIVAVRGCVQDVYAVEVHAFNVKVDRYAKTVADGVISFERVGSCKCARAQSEEHHNCQKDCDELFHYVHSSESCCSPVLFCPRSRDVLRGTHILFPLLPCAEEAFLFNGSRLSR